MAEVTDILTDEEGDLMVVNGDFSVGESTVQHQGDLIVACEGEYKQDPMTGVGAVNFVDDEGPSEFLRKVRIQFTKDGMNVTRSQMNTNGNLEIEAEYL